MRNEMPDVLDLAAPNLMAGNSWSELVSGQVDAAATAPVPFVVCLGIGAVASWYACKLFYDQRIAHGQELIAHLQNVVADKYPALTPKLIVGKRSRRMTAGLLLIFAGLTAAFLGAVLVALDVRLRIAKIEAAPAATDASESQSQKRSSLPVLTNSLPPGDEQRQFTNRSARELLALYEGRTPLQAEKLIEPYKGKWIKIEATVVTVLADGGNGSIIVAKDGDRAIECRLNANWSTQVAKLNRDDTVKLVGRINEYQNGSQLYLQRCELI